MTDSMRVVFGGKDMVEQLEDVLERVKAGELEAIVIVGWQTKAAGSGFGWTAQNKEDMPWPWARMCAGVADVSREMLSQPCEEWQ